MKRARLSPAAFPAFLSAFTLCLTAFPSVSEAGWLFSRDTIYGRVDCYSDTATTLQNTTSSDWWYGCTATSGGMLMAYYDTNGYKGASFGNLIPGGTAGSSAIGDWPNGQLLRATIASEEHQRDYYGAATRGYNTGGGTSALGYGAEKDDVASGAHADNCIADFLGTSQDSCHNSNGSTQTYYYTDGHRLDYTDQLGITDKWSATGLANYVSYCGYGVLDCFSQYSDIYMTSKSLTGGFSFADFETEIDAGRGVILNLTNATLGGHSVLGIGYDAATKSVELYNTWDSSIHTAAWDTGYIVNENGTDYTFSISGVIGMELTPVPEPSTYAFIAAFASFGIVLVLRRGKAGRRSAGC
jgi:hypothetical protein